MRGTSSPRRGDDQVPLLSPPMRRRRWSSCVARAPTSSTRGSLLPRLLCGLAVNLARSRPSRDHRSHRAPARGLTQLCRTSTRTSTMVRSPRRSIACSAAAGQVFFANSGAEAKRVCAPAGPQVFAAAVATSWSARTAAYQRALRLATLHATGQPAKHEAFPTVARGFRPSRGAMQTSSSPLRRH